MWSCAWLASTGMGDDAGGGLAEGSSAYADLPAEMSIQIHTATSCFPQYMTLVYRGALEPNREDAHLFAVPGIITLHRNSHDDPAPFIQIHAAPAQ